MNSSAGNPSRIHEMFETPVESPEFVKLLFDRAADGYIVLDKKRRILYMNQRAADLTGQSTEAHEPCWKLFRCHDNDHNQLTSEQCYGLCAFRTQHTVQGAQIRIRHTTGASVPILVTYSNLYTETPDPLLLMCLRPVNGPAPLEKRRRQNEYVHYALQEREQVARTLLERVTNNISRTAEKTSRLTNEDDGSVSHEVALHEVSKSLESCFVELRQTIYDLTTPVGQDLHGYVDRYLSSYRTRSSLAISYSTTGRPRNVDPYIAAQMAGVLQDVLSHLRPHADIERIDVKLSFSRKTIQRPDVYVQLTVTAYGAKLHDVDKSGAMELERMLTQRCRKIQGSCSFKSTPEPATITRIHARVTPSVY